MNLDMTRVDHQPLKIRLINDFLQDLLPQPVFYPTAKSLGDTVPVPVSGRQITPWRACSQNPEYPVDKFPIVFRYPAPLAFLTWQIRFQQQPYRIRYIVTMLQRGHNLISIL
jgi:hypothetical protein